MIEGALSCAAPIIAVMDGDLQHDETLLQQMLDLIKKDQADIVVGSRFLQRSDAGSLSAGRERMSRIGNWLSRSVIKTRLSDPLSGFFMIKRGVFDEVVRDLSGSGFKFYSIFWLTQKRLLVSLNYPFNLVSGCMVSPKSTAW